jgi:hypothetical protein
MKFKKHNNAKRNLNKLNIKFDEVRDCMADDGHVFGVDYEFVDGEVIAFTQPAYLTAKGNGFPVDCQADENK